MLTFNIRTATGRDGPDRWRRRRDVAAGVLQRADVAGVQEARSQQLTDLTLGAPGHRWFGRGRADGDRGGEHVPVFWRADRFVCVDGGVFWHSATPDVPGSRDHERAITRMATWVRLTERSSGQPVFMLNTHLDHRVPEARLAAADQIRVEVDRRAGSDPVIVTGDLNDRPGSPPSPAADRRRRPGRADRHPTGGPAAARAREHPARLRAGQAGGLHRPCPGQSALAGRAVERRARSCRRPVPVRSLPGVRRSHASRRLIPASPFVTWSDMHCYSSW